MAHTLLYGGTFDPIHHGHLIACRRAGELLAADRILLIPARISPHKTDVEPAASAEHRLAMIRLAIAGIAGFAVDDTELSRPGPSYTIDTIEALRRQSPREKWTLLIGEDQLPKLWTWHRAGELFADLGSGGVAVAILQRNGLGEKSLPDGRGSEGPSDLQRSLSEIAARLGQPTADRLAHCLLRTPRIDISSTDIRRRVREGLSIDFLLPPSLAAYIRDHHLYQ